MSLDGAEKSDTRGEKSEIGNPLYCSYIDGVYTYRDPSTTNEFVWEEASSEWRPKRVFGTTVQYDGTSYTYADPQDGTLFEWDPQKYAWFPKLDEEFLARYQLSYGVTDSSSAQQQPSSSSSTTTGTSEAAAAEERFAKGGGKGQKRKLPAQPASWFEVDETQNTKVYVSNLPGDITDEEFVEFMNKCGLIMKDPNNGNPRIKLYTDSEGNKKGDGLCTYIKVESVDIALQILDGSDLRGKTVKVERAKFELKGQYDPTKKPKSKKKKDKEKLKKMQDKLFEWKPEQLRGERPNHERIVVVQNAFLPSDFDQDVGLILEYQQDFREEAAKCGKCKKVVVFDRHPEGVLQIYMTTPEEADAVVALFNNRFFGGKKISAFNWDGRTKYKIEETDAERDKRLQNWEKFIAEDEGAGAAAAASGSYEAPGPAADPEDDKETPPPTPPDLGGDELNSDSD